MTETEFRTLLCSMLAPLAAMRVENIVQSSESLGTPDVCCSVGWIETKLGKIPARAGTKLYVKLRVSQQVWHRRWRRTGAVSWTLTLVHHEDQEHWLLHDGLWAADNLGVATWDECRVAAIDYQPGRPTAQALIATLTKKRTTW